MKPTPLGTRYRLLSGELSPVGAPRCSNPLCKSFLPPPHAQPYSWLYCFACVRRTCRRCGKEDHGGVTCPQDVAAGKARALAQRRGWKTCPGCANIVEKAEGCSHVTCLCGAHFCYRCGEFMSVCKGTCWFPHRAGPSAEQEQRRRRDAARRVCFGGGVDARADAICAYEGERPANRRL